MSKATEVGVTVGTAGPTVTMEAIKDKVIRAQYYVFPGTTLTVCCLLMENGFTVTGESACADPANYNEEVGKKYARENALSKVWPLEGYLLRERISEGQVQ